MIFDSNTYIGHYPFRKTTCKSAVELKSYLTESGIGRAIVSSMPAVFYRDCLEGNLELLAEVGAMRDFFEPAAVINPMYPSWEKDMRMLHREHGVRVIKLFPYIHGYFLQHEKAVCCLRLAAELGMPVSLPVSIENPLQRHRLDADRFVCEDELVAAARLAPEATILLHNSSAFLYAKAESAAGLHRSGKILYDFSRIDAIAQDTLWQTIEAVGADRIIFGSGAPLTYIDTQLAKLWFLQQTEHSAIQLEAFACNNLLQELGE